jgi:hypothetical protein
VAHDKQWPPLDRITVILQNIVNTQVMIYSHAKL